MIKRVFLTKFNEHGTIDCYKARLVAQRYVQIPGLEFEETFFPVGFTKTIRVVILSTAITLKWIMRQFDMKNASLHGNLMETIYIEKPLALQIQNLQIMCKLNKSIYGLKQAPRAWFESVPRYLFKLNFKCSKANPSLFILHEQNSVTLMLVYVDDIIIIGNNSSIIKRVIKVLSKEFALKDLG